MADQSKGMNPLIPLAGTASDFLNSWLERRNAAKEKEKDRAFQRDESGKDRRLTQDDMILELIMKGLENQFMNERDQAKHKAMGSIAERGIIQSRSPLDRPISTVTALDKPRTYGTEGGTGASLSPGGTPLSEQELFQLAPRNFNEWQSISQQAHQDVGAMGLTSPLPNRPTDLLGEWQKADPGSYGRNVTAPGVPYANQRGDYFNDQDIADFQKMQAQGMPAQEIQRIAEERRRARGYGG